MTRVAFVALAAATFACGATAPRFVTPVTSEPADPPKPPATAQRSSALVAKTLEAMGKLRGLVPKHSVPCAVVSPAELLARVKEHVAREIPPDAIAAEGIAQKLFGFIPTSMDYEAAEYELLGGELAGYYEPANGTMYLASNLDAENATATLSHELVHALQDQYWDLRTRSVYVAGEDDRESALSALAEGDATSAMEALTAAREGTGPRELDTPDAELTARWMEGVEAGTPRNTPHALRMSLVAPYIDGTLFVKGLRRRGGWAAVDEAWTTLPVTTEQILHPDKWRSHEPALLVADPPAPPSSSGLVRIESNTYGEQGLRLAFAEWMGAPLASVSASGWGGDRIAIYRHANDQVAMLWHVRFDDASSQHPAAFASRAFDALASALPARGRETLRTSQSFCVERAGNGVMALTRDGEDLLLAFGTVTTNVEPWHAAMSCADALAWNAEALRMDHRPR